MEPAPQRGENRLRDIESALRLFDETTSALSSQVQRLEQVLIGKQQELVTANAALSTKVGELDALSAYLNLVMGAVVSGVIAVDSAGIITTCNPAARAALAGVVAEAVGADYRALFPDSPLLRLLGGAEAVGAYERTLPGVAGDRRILAAKAASLRDRDGRVLGAVEVFEDVSEMRRLQESVERADRLAQLGEMAAGVAHEVRNPLNGIEGFASLLARDLAGDPRQRFAERIVEGVRMLNRTVSGLLEFTRPKRPERTPVDLATIVNATLDLVRSELELAGPPTVTLEVDNRWPGQTIAADAAQLRQVLLNLLQNAVHAARESRGDAAHVSVTIAISDDDDDAVLITVDDNGPGVPAELRQRIFTPFYTTKDHGTGLGLAVSYTIVSLHGGTLTVDDSPLGGARFRIALPL